MRAILRGTAFRTMAWYSTAAAGFVLLAATSLTWLGYALLAVVLVIVGVQYGKGDRTARYVELALLAAGVVADAAGGGGHPWWAVAGFLLLAAVLTQPVLSWSNREAKPTANLAVAPEPRMLKTYVQPINVGLVAVLAAGAALHLPAWPFVLVNAVACAVYGATVVRQLRQRKPAVEEDNVRAAVEALQPTFALHHSGPEGSEYQLLMWLPYLEELGKPFYVLLREPHALAAVAAATSAPVIVCPSITALEEMLVPSLRTVFYVNNGMKNVHCVRFNQLTHIQLMHGDSEKPPSFSPVTAIFDQVFVAGQAAIDRFAANGVRIPVEKFAIVGRPQVAQIAAPRGHIWDLTDKVVLYAPTWTGHYTDMNYCSLPVAEPLIRELLEHKATVILRPHPYSSRHPQSAQQIQRLEEILAADQAQYGRQHIWGAAATTALSVVDCFNRADAMVTDVSSVITDFIFSGKPFALTDMIGDPGFMAAFPMAKAAYVLRRDMANAAEMVTSLLQTDPAEETRRQMRVHYLGDFPRETYVNAFLTEAGKYI